ncbi:protein PET117 homolog, mitochondrial [Culicoides brevitarsis]|uniref:protein PET117 homolog, mitochondrial n=1 Tax=Culicoides brevitarsis TaxID=469753 RepID=UPI00307BE9D0
MSTASRYTLYGSLGVSLGIIAYVCGKQQYDRHVLREGVWRDVERQQRKTENIYLLQQQIDLTKQLKAQQEKSGKSLETNS